MEGEVFIGYYFLAQIIYSLVGETLATLVSGFVKTFNLDGKYNL